MTIVNTYVPHIANIAPNGALSASRSTDLMAVLTQDDAGLYAAYIGLVPALDRNLSDEAKESLRAIHAEGIAYSGNKLRWNEIGMFFRGISKEEYRA